MARAAAGVRGGLAERSLADEPRRLQSCGVDRISAGRGSGYGSPPARPRPSLDDSSSILAGNSEQATATTGQHRNLLDLPCCPLFEGVGKKVRFYLTVSKAELLRAPFSTQGGDRLVEARLRVTVRAAGASTLYVRDGRIKVSIARIKSGALSGLTGIL